MNRREYLTGARCGQEMADRKKQGRDAVPVSMCSDCYCSVANGLDSIDVTDERHDEIAAGLVSAGPRVVVDVEDDGGFSMSRCDVCGTRLGGDRFRGWLYPVTA